MDRFLTLFLPALWTLLVLISGILIGWRVRGGLAPLPSLPKFTRKREDPNAKAPKPPAQEGL